MKTRLSVAVAAVAIALPTFGAGVAQAYDNYFNGVLNPSGDHTLGTPHNTSGVEADTTGPNAWTGIQNVYWIKSGSAYDVAIFNYYRTGKPTGHNHDPSAHYYHLFWFN